MPKIIISLTTISSRINILQFVIESLLTQTMKADYLYINISKNPYLLDEGFNFIPFWLTELEKNKKIIINWVDNIGPYRKLIPLIKQFEPEDIIIICDDDVLYSENWLRDLYNESHNNPNTIVCYCARKIKKTFFNYVHCSYIYWPFFYGKGSHSDILPIGVGGVLYKVNYLNLSSLLDDNYLKIAPKADDIWFWNSCKPKLKVSVLEHNNSNTFSTISTFYNLFELNYASKNSSRTFIIRKFFELLGRFGYPVTQNDITFRKIIKLKN